MLNKTSLLHQSLGPRVFLSLSLSLRRILWSAEAHWAHFLAWASKTPSRRHSAPSPHQEGSRCLCEQRKPRVRSLLVFCINQGILASFSLLYFLIIDSRPPGSGPLKDLNSGLQSMGSQRVGHNWATSQAHTRMHSVHAFSLQETSYPSWTLEH